MNTVKRFFSTVNCKSSIEKRYMKDWSNKTKQNFDSFINNEKNRKLVALLKKNCKEEANEKFRKK